MTFEYLRVIVVVYTSALLPLLLVPLLYKRGRLPSWVPGAYLGSFLLCALGWEIWFTYGLWAGDPVDLRRSEVLTQFIPIHINWLMNSLADAGSITLVGLWFMWLSGGRSAQVFQSWHWWPFAVFMLWALGQNILVEMFLYHDQLAVGNHCHGHHWHRLGLGGIRSCLNLMDAPLRFRDRYPGCWRPG